ncbi:MAG: NADH-quinone oxidoreductase subunit J [Candidatus Zixiibacteriota bacterium]|nr:MAG: NADH-quinone oxidoreductase subunit J [candidate division Zixibacteria bacterium]
MAVGDVGIVFWILSVAIIVSACMVVSLRNIFHCALALILCLFAVAGIFILLGAEFLAAAQVLIYVGAVAILMIFAIMLTSNLAAKKITQTNENALVGLLVCVFFTLVGWVLLKKTYEGIWSHLELARPLPSDNILTLGKYLMTQYALPFEVVSILLLAAMIGAIVLARKENA